MKKPSKKELFDAAYVCTNLANHVEEIEPFAVNDIRSLKSAAEILDAFADDDYDSDYDYDDCDGDNDGGNEET